jgi:cytochrome c553
MSELYKAVVGCVAIATFFIFMIMPNMAYSGYSSSSSCTGECYEEYVALNGTAPEIEQRKKALANLDEFSDIRSLWAGCAACHGADGGGGIGPKLAGQSSSDIVSKLTTYKNKGQIGSQSALMWGQAAMLSAKDMETIGAFIEAGLPK